MSASSFTRHGKPKDEFEFDSMAAVAKVNVLMSFLEKTLTTIDTEAQGTSDCK